MNVDLLDPNHSGLHASGAQPTRVRAAAAALGCLIITGCPGDAPQTDSATHGEEASTSATSDSMTTGGEEPGEDTAVASTGPGATDPTSGGSTMGTTEGGDGTTGSEVCKLPQADCNEDPSDGCEANLDLDPDNCGGCETPCIGACVDGACAEPVVLIGGQDFVDSIASDDAFVYWASRGDFPGWTNGEIRRMPKDGGAVAVLASDLPYPLRVAVADGRAYWGNRGSVDQDFADGSVMSVSVTGGPIQILASGDVPDIRALVLGEDTVFFESGGAGEPDTLYSVPADGSAAPTELLATDGVNGLLWTEDGLIFNRRTIDGADEVNEVNELVRVPLAGGEPTVLASFDEPSGSPVLAGSPPRVYVSVGLASIVAVPLDGGDAEVFELGGYLSATGDASHLYWADTFAQLIGRKRVDGSAPSTLLGVEALALTVVADSDSLYFSVGDVPVDDSFTIYRLARPAL